VETTLGILGFVALFVAFGLFRPGARRGCGGDCGGSCSSDSASCDVIPRANDPMPGMSAGKES